MLGKFIYDCIKGNVMPMLLNKTIANYEIVFPIPNNPQYFKGEGIFAKDIRKALANQKHQSFFTEYVLKEFINPTQDNKVIYNYISKAFDLINKNYQHLANSIGISILEYLLERIYTESDPKKKLKLDANLQEALHICYEPITDRERLIRSTDIVGDNMTFYKIVKTTKPNTSSAINY